MGFGLLLVASILGGCQFGYYWHLFRGQARIVLGSRDLSSILDGPGLDDAAVEKLMLVGQLRRFASERAGLETGSNYTRFYDTGGGPVSWNLSASPADRFEPYLWAFPVVGRVPYKGYFDRIRGQAERDQLSAAGYDVLLRPVSAYSTLGFFPDPVLSSMLAYPLDSLADLLLHELTHATVYAAGHTEFNESLATFVGRSGSLLFLADRYGDQAPILERARRRREEAALFRLFVQLGSDDLRLSAHASFTCVGLLGVALVEQDEHLVDRVVGDHRLHELVLVVAVLKVPLVEDNVHAVLGQTLCEAQNGSLMSRRCPTVGDEDLSFGRLHRHAAS